MITNCILAHLQVSQPAPADGESAPAVRYLPDLTTEAERMELLATAAAKLAEGFRLLAALEAMEGGQHG